MNTIETPPLDSLRAIGDRLEREGLTWALGGSGLLVALGRLDWARDWDLTCDVPAVQVAAALADLSPIASGHSGIHADEKVMCPALASEVICRFAFFTPSGVIRIPTRVSGEWRGFPLASPEGWAVAYALMGELEDSAPRRERARLLLEHLAERGADPTARQELLAQPLPEAIARALASLPPRRRA